jgi:chemotaxis protein MotB
MSGRDHSLLEDEGTGYLVSVSDIMAGLLFVFIITLIAFVIQFQDASVKKELERRDLEEKVDELSNTRDLRRKLLADIEAKLKDKGLEVKVDQELGILRLTDQTVQFRSSSDDLDDKPRENLAIIADVLDELLPCYAGIREVTLVPQSCPPNAIGKLEAVFIEGHTDNVPLPKSSRKRGDSNWHLSAKRAIKTYQYLIERQPNLSLLMNENQEPLFSVAGYADQRPLVEYETPTDDARNRRIDLRFIMRPPKETAEIVQAIHNKGVK